jgi:competence protein ComEC
MAGLAMAGRAGPAAISPAPLVLAAVLLLTALAMAKRHPAVWAAAVATAALLAGRSAFELHRGRAPARAAFGPCRATLSLRLDQVAPPRPRGPPAARGIATVVDGAKALRGRRIYFSLYLRPRQPAPIRSAEIRARGLVLMVPGHPASGSFDEYLNAQGVDFLLVQGFLIGELRPPSSYRRFCERLGNRMYALLGAGLERHPDLAQAYRAMMLGRRGDLDERQRELFLRSGTMHLFAINGLHVGIVAVALHAFLALLRFPRALTTAATLGILWLDVDTTGDSPSAVRALVMIATYEAGGTLALAANPLSALAASAMITLLAHPLDFFGASFEMSYGVVAGIVTLGLPLAERLRARMPLRRLPALARARDHLCGSLGVGIAAGLVGTLAGVRFFGLIAPAALIANLAIAPLAALVIVAGFASIAMGLSGAAPASRFCNLAAGTLIASIQSLLHQILRLPGAFATAHYRAEWVGPGALFLLLGACLAGCSLGWKRGFWPPFAVVAIALVFGVKYGR